MKLKCNVSVNTINDNKHKEISNTICHDDEFLKQVIKNAIAESEMSVESVEKDNPMKREYVKDEDTFSVTYTFNYKELLDWIILNKISLQKDE